MSIDKITKDAFDEVFKEMVEETENNIKSLSETYIKLLEFRSQYRKDYKTHRIVHYLSDSGGLRYKLNGKRQIGFTYKNQQKNERNDV